MDASEYARSSIPLAILRAPGAQTDGTRHAIVNPDAEDSVESSTESDAESTRTNDPDASSIVSDFGPFTSTDKKYSNFFRVNQLLETYNLSLLPLLIVLTVQYQLLYLIRQRNSHYDLIHNLILSIIFLYDRSNLSVAGSADASLLGTSPAGEKEKRRGGGLRNVLERIGNSYIVQRTLELQVVTRAIEGVSNTPIALEVAIEQLEGDLVIHIPPPPSDRLWYLTNTVYLYSTVYAYTLIFTYS